MADDFTVKANLVTTADTAGVEKLEQAHVRAEAGAESLADALNTAGAKGGALGSGMEGGAGRGLAALQSLTGGVENLGSQIEGIAAAAGLGGPVVVLLTLLASGLAALYEKVKENEAALKAMNEPLDGYATEAELAEQRTRAFSDALDAEAAAAAKAAAALKIELDLLKSRNAILEAQDANQQAQTNREIEASNMPPEEKARAKAEAAVLKERQDFQRREEERAKQGDVMRGEAEAKDRAARALAKDADEAARRRAQLQTRQGLSEVTIPEREKALREAQDTYSAGTAEGVISPAQAAELQRQVQEAQAALDKAKADRDAIAPGDASEAAKNEAAAREASKKAAQEAAAARAAAMAGQQRNALEGQADAIRTGGKIDSIMWSGDAEAAAAVKKREEQKTRDAEKAAKSEKPAKGSEPPAFPLDGSSEVAGSLRAAGFNEAANKLETTAANLSKGGGSDADVQAAVRALEAVEKVLQGAQRGDLAKKLDALTKRVETLAAQHKNRS